MTTLPCGCERGIYLCNIAETLWRNSMAAWGAGNNKEGDKWRDLYEAHFEQNNSPEFAAPEQGAME